MLLIPLAAGTVRQRVVFWTRLSSGVAEACGVNALLLGGELPRLAVIT